MAYTKDIRVGDISIRDFTSLMLDILRESQPAFLTKAQTARLLKCSVSILDIWAKKGRLKRIKVGHSVRYRRSDIEKFIIADYDGR